MTNANVYEGIAVLFIWFVFFWSFQVFSFTVYLYNFTSLHYKHTLVYSLQTSIQSKR